MTVVLSSRECTLRIDVSKETTATDGSVSFLATRDEPCFLCGTLALPSMLLWAVHTVRNVGREAGRSELQPSKGETESLEKSEL